MRVGETIILRARVFRGGGGGSGSIGGLNQAAGVGGVAVEFRAGKKGQERYLGTATTNGNGYAELRYTFSAAGPVQVNVKDRYSSATQTVTAR